MSGVGLGLGPITGIAAISGGTQNILFRFQRDGVGYVLRCPATHLASRGGKFIIREARVLSALGGSDVPHPRLFAACDDVDVIGTPFHLTEFVDGFTPALGLGSDYAHERAGQRAMGFAITEAIATLGRLDVASCGLSDLGTPKGWLERQVPRWQSQLDRYGELPGYPGPDLRYLDEIGAWLSDKRPSEWQVGLIHGDLHFGNALFDREQPTVVAIVDWELSALGDPLLDLGHLLACWPRQPGDAHVTYVLPGLPDHAEIAEFYAECTGRDVTWLAWYRVLACYRLAIIIEGSYARACAGQGDLAIGQRLHASAKRLLTQAAALIG